MTDAGPTAKGKRERWLAERPVPSYFILSHAYAVALGFAFLGSAVSQGQRLTRQVFVQSMENGVMLFLLGLPLLLVLLSNIWLFGVNLQLIQEDRTRLLMRGGAVIIVALPVVIVTTHINSLIWRSYWVIQALFSVAGVFCVVIFLYLLLVVALFVDSPKSYLRNALTNPGLWLGYVFLFILMMASLFLLFEAQTVNVHEPTLEDIMRMSRVEWMFALPLTLVLPALPWLFLYTGKKRFL